MANIKGVGVRVEIASTYGGAETVTAVTLASPGVATSAGHGLANNTVGYWTVTDGMPQIDGMATRVKNTATNTFDLQGVNTTAYSAFVAGTYTPVTAWATLAEATGYDIGGGGVEQLNASRLIDVVQQFENGLLNGQPITLPTLAQDSNNAAMQLIEDAALTGGFVIVRITLQTGAVRIARCQCSLPGESVSSGQLGTGSVTLTPRGLVGKLAA
jgi:hypothetical protein